MSRNRRNGILYLAAAVFCALAAIYNIKTHDIVFIVIAAISAVVFGIASAASFNAAKEARRAAMENKSSKSKKKSSKKKK